MASIIKAPMIAQSFYQTKEVSGLQRKLADIRSKYGETINLVASMTGVLAEIITSFIFIESGGNPSAISRAGAMGLMQLKPDSAGDMIFYEHSKKRLSLAEEIMLRSVLGKRMDCILAMRYMGHKLPCNNNKGVIIMQQDLMNPNFSILVGAIFLGILIDQETENGIVRLDRVVYRYNKGYFSKPPKNVSIEKLVADANPETKAYILKLTGKNGLMEIIA